MELDEDPEIIRIVTGFLDKDQLFDEGTTHPESASKTNSTTDTDRNPDTHPSSLGASEALTGMADYAELTEIGRGGIGMIYRARQISLNRDVAIKVIRDAQSRCDSDFVRFRLEAESAARLSHPNIVPIYEIGDDGQAPFFTMKLIDGENLSQWLRQSDHDLSTKITIVEKSARAIHYAHQNGVLHRDIKPANILIDHDDQPHVTDFGLAKNLGVSMDLTLTGQIMGTPSYMSPEQASGDQSASTVAIDVYGLGAVLYQCLTGNPPFTADNMYDVVRMVVDQPVTAPSRLATNVDRDLNTICLKCLEKEPEKRYASALDLADDLNRWRLDEPITARPVGWIERSAKWFRRNQTIATLACSSAAMLVIAFGIIGWLGSRYLQSRQERQGIQAVQEIREANVGEIESLLEQFDVSQPFTQMELEKRFEKASPAAPERTNLAMALSTQNPDYAEFLIARLGKLSPPELTTVIEFLRPHTRRVGGKLIGQFQNDSLAMETRVAAAAALIELDLSEVVWPMLRHSADPTARSAVIARLSDLSIGCDKICQTLPLENNEGIRRALVQILASQDETELSQTQRSCVWSVVGKLFVNDSDPGVHAAADQAFFQWTVEPPTLSSAPTDKTVFVEIDAELAKVTDRIESILSTRPKHQIQWESGLERRSIKPPLDQVALYRFDRDSDRFKDEVTGTSGKPIGPGKLVWTDGILGMAVHLQGDSTIECENEFKPDYTTPFSMGCWIVRQRPAGELTAQQAADAEYGTVLSRLAAGQSGFDLWMNDGSLSSHLVSSGQGMIKVAGTESLPKDQWQHVFVTYDGTKVAEGMTLYVNGRPVEHVVIEPGLYGPIDRSAPFCIGQRYDGGKGTSRERYPFFGLVDEVRLYDRQLSEFEVSQLYQMSLAEIADVHFNSRTFEQSHVLVSEHQRELLEPLTKQRKILQSRRRELRDKTQVRWLVGANEHTMSIVSRPAHEGGEVLPYGLAVGQCPVTVEQYLRFDDSATCDTNIAPSPNCPMNSVSRHDAAAYCNWLSKKDGLSDDQCCYVELEPDPEHGKIFRLKDSHRDLLGYRLPTLDEWHHVCRANASTLYSFGDDPELFSRYGWSSENSDGRSHPVGSLLPNDFGIFDMHGGLWEWCSTGTQDDSRLAGGCLYQPPGDLTWKISQSRSEYTRDSDVGFRVVRRLK